MKKTFISTGQFFYFHRYSNGGGFVLDFWKWELRVQWIFRFEVFFNRRDDLDFKKQELQEDTDMIVSKEVKYISEPNSDRWLSEQAKIKLKDKK